MACMLAPSCTWWVDPGKQGIQRLLTGWMVVPLLKREALPRSRHKVRGEDPTLCLCQTSHIQVARASCKGWTETSSAQKRDVGPRRRCRNT
ncbi:hypothetical protein P7K49_014256, partial [Saguinus oedipus]